MVGGDLCYHWTPERQREREREKQHWKGALEARGRSQRGRRRSCWEDGEKKKQEGDAAAAAAG